MKFEEEICGCGHSRAAHDFSFMECGICNCKRYYRIEYTSTTMPPHFLHENIYYDGNRYIDFRDIVSYWHEQAANGMSTIDISLANGFKFKATNYGDDRYLYDALLEWHKLMGNMIERRYRESRRE